MTLWKRCPSLTFSRTSKLPEFNDSSEFFTNPTLFELMRERKRVRHYEKKQSRIRNGGDQFIQRKPQAKDVSPFRTLDTEDERRILNNNNNNDSSNSSPEGSQNNCNQSRVYINPLVPKKRKYLAESKLPALFRQFSATRKDAESSASRQNTELSNGK